jgi:hypothetical protein
MYVRSRKEKRTYVKNLQRLLDALSAVRGEGVQKWPAHTDCSRPQRNRLQHVRRASHAPIHEELELLVRERKPPLLFELAGDLDEDLDPRAGKV